MAPTTIFAIFFLSITSVAATSIFSFEFLTAYDLLQQYGFPRGILPKGINSYDLDPSSGNFHAYLNSTCAFSLEGSYQLRYQSTISGSVSEKKIKNLNGISVKVLFLWLDIVEVVRKGEDLQFSVGITSASFSIDNFLESPQCGCGFNCVNKPRTPLSSASSI